MRTKRRRDRKATSSRMQRGIVPFCVLVLAIGLFASSNLSVNAAPQQSYWSQFEEEDPEALMDIITRLGRTMMLNPEVENSKRGLDLGLSRGFSGSQAAKHLMGLAAANYAGGPGRRRRSEQP
ncbi:diuretic hormone class 2 isoform X1 [Megachile rotundata]|uniref:diuretic hormone class 2 isoform X1 n=2 Tax=Megachile rotundata TaxID=143995 RepID=UPI00061526F8|nr:PREDICTED: diuretic hormone class 2 isoform X1 [Megachile rotundata]